MFMSIVIVRGDLLKLSVMMCLWVGFFEVNLMRCLMLFFLLVSVIGRSVVCSRGLSN